MSFSVSNSKGQSIKAEVGLVMYPWDSNMGIVLVNKEGSPSAPDVSVFLNEDGELTISVLNKKEKKWMRWGRCLDCRHERTVLVDRPSGRLLSRF